MKRFYSELSSSMQWVIKVGAMVGACATIYAGWTAIHIKYAKAEQVEAVSEKVDIEVNKVQTKATVDLKTIQQQFIWVQKRAVEKDITEYELDVMIADEPKYKTYYKKKLANAKLELRAFNLQLQHSMGITMPMATGTISLPTAAGAPSQ